MKTRLKIDLTIDEDKMMSGKILVRGNKSLITAALFSVSEKNTTLREAIKKVAEANRIKYNEEDTQND